MTLQRKKEVGLVVVAGLATMLFWLSLSLFLRVPEPTASPWLPVIVLAGLLWVIVIDFVMAVCPQIVSSLIVILVAGGMVIVAGGGKLAAIIGALVLAACLAIAKQIITREITNRVRYSTTQIFLVGSRYSMLGLVVAISALSLPLLSQSIYEERLVIPEDYLMRITAPLDPIVGSLFPGLGASSTVDELLDQQLAEQLPPGTVISEAQRASLRQELAKQIGTNSLAGNETFSQLAATKVNQLFKDFARRSPFILALALVVIVFLALRFLIPLLVWPVIAGLAALMALARVIGLTYLVRAEATVERITL